jgi:hypothetical protein
MSGPLALKLTPFTAAEMLKGFITIGVLSLYNFNMSLVFALMGTFAIA